MPRGRVPRRDEARPRADVLRTRVRSRRYGTEVGMPSSWIQELRTALRGAGRAKGFHATAVLTLAVGMAGAAVMSTLVRGILLRPLPVPDEDRLVVSWRVAPDGPT